MPQSINTSLHQSSIIAFVGQQQEHFGKEGFHFERR